MRIRSRMTGKVVSVSDKLGRALIRGGRFEAADTEPAPPAQPVKPARKRSYRRRDLRPEE